MVADDDARTGAVGERNEGLRAARTLARAVEAAGGTAVVVHADTGKDYADTAAEPALHVAWFPQMEVDRGNGRCIFHVDPTMFRSKAEANL